MEDDIRTVVGAELPVTEVVQAFKTRYLMIAIYMVLASVLIVLGITAVMFRNLHFNEVTDHDHHENP